MTDPITLAFQHNLGPWLMALHGKVPAFDGWRTLGPVTEDTVREWIDIGYNLGFRTGIESGVVVIDDDRVKYGEEPYPAPATELVALSPSGSRHYYYAAPDPCPRNSASQLAPHVDVRGEGGYVVFPGSAHAEHGTPYVWDSFGTPAAYPAAPTIVNMDAEPEPRGAGYADTALLQEVHRVRTATPGARNDQLNRAAFSLGQLVAGGELDRGTVTEQLTAAAKLAGDGGRGEDRKIAGTISSGLTAGAQHPRTAPAPEARKEGSATSTVSETARANPSSRPEVLTPGAHQLPPEGEYLEQGSDLFAAQCLDRIPPGALYRRAQVVGEIHGDAFQPVKPDRMRTITDQHVRLGAGRENKDGTHSVQFRSCSRDHASLVLAYAETQGKIRELRQIANHPITVGPDFTLAEPGWNADHGVYRTDDGLDLPDLDLESARAVLEDLVVDFPFATPADRANFFGLLLTPILRPSLDGNTPMHLVGSPVERTGKSKLIESVFGGVIQGRPLEATPFGVREEEREKRIFSLVLGGDSLCHLDNLTEFLGSASLASLLTATQIRNRLLGGNRMVSVPNSMTIVGSSNNMHASGEIAKRIVPIILVPATESPESRQDFAHPDLGAFILSERPRALAALLRLVEAWKGAGRPLSRKPLGGFERWASVVGGILEHAGYPEWLENLATWRGGSDDFSGELREFVNAWHAAHLETDVETGVLFDLADRLELFQGITSQSTDRGRRTSFGMRVLNAIVDRVVGEFRIQSRGKGSRRRLRLASEPRRSD